MTDPVCLIKNGPERSFSVQQEAVEILEQIRQPVVVVAVVGLYRTGKSYLLNRLAGKKPGFALGRTIDSKTKGIWMWCVPHPSKPRHTLVLLDTEGLGDVKKGDEKHDMGIFCLAVLLSSTLVYNSMKTIDNNALEKLEYVTKLTELIKVNTKEYKKNTELMRVFPSFVWTVRDFSLDLESEDKPITADDYLERALELKQDADAPPDVEKRNKVRQSLRDVFAVRRCFVMDCPANGETMKRMEELTDADLNSTFVKQSQDFCSYVHENAWVKTMRGGRGLTGRMLGRLAKTYVEAICSGKAACLESAAISLAKIQNEQAMAEALEFYRKEMENNVQLPTETHKELSEIHTAAEKQAISIYIKASFNDEENEHQSKLMMSLNEEYKELCKKNTDKSEEVCKSVISRVFASMEAGLKDGSYMRPEGYKEFYRALDRGVQLYRSEKGKGVLTEEVLSEYLKNMGVVAQDIVTANREFEQKIEEQLQKRLERYEYIKQQVIRDLKRSKDENISQLKIKMELENSRADEELQRVLMAKLKEREILLERDFKDKVKQMEEDINNLKLEKMRVEERKGLGWVGKTLETVLNAAVTYYTSGTGTVIRSLFDMNGSEWGNAIATKRPKTN
ncbi:guanylate-binding protein 1-like [Alosa pseudoharengus]|uniref:guanylate-binding protein 1-like n=1 Tax=Alosa pseudoharengus TaxID=34774 RepID=UPI003F8BE31A